VHDLAPVTSVLRFDPPHPDPPRRGMAESFSTRVRGIESVQARLAPISGWEGVHATVLSLTLYGGVREPPGTPPISCQYL
jgi:hypothetical protein